MRIVMLNDTRVGDPNPGCHATVSSLVRLLSRTTGSEVRTIPIGYGYEYFAALGGLEGERAADAWRAAVGQLARDPWTDTLASADLVVANLEGTFHHHTIGALVLGGALAVAHRQRKRVWAVNGTVEAIEPWLLGETLAAAEHVAVREPCSAAFLASQGIQSVLAADCAFLAEPLSVRGSTHSQSRAVLYTPGVLAQTGQRNGLSPDDVLSHLAVLTKAGWDATYLNIGAREEEVAFAVSAAGWPVMDARQVPWHAIGAYARQFDLVVSGRYHILIFAAMAGVPAIALASNTWKMQGLLELLGSRASVAQDAAVLHAMLRDVGPPATVDPAVVRRCRILAEGNLPAIERRSLHAESPNHGTRAAGHVDGTCSVARIPAIEGLDWARVTDAIQMLTDLHRSGPEQFETTVACVPLSCSQDTVLPIRPLGTWRRVFRAGGFDVLSERRIPSADAGEGMLRTARGRWAALNPFRDEHASAACVFELRRRPSAAVERSSIECLLDGQLRPYLQASSPSSPDVDGRLTFLVSGYRDLEQFLPLWMSLPAKAFSIVAPPSADASIPAPWMESLQAWCRRRGIRLDTTWRTSGQDGTGRRPRALIACVDSRDLLKSALIMMAARNGWKIIQLQREIWSGNSLQDALTIPSNLLLAWADGERSDSSRLVPAGSPRLDAYANPDCPSLGNLLGEWIEEWERHILVAVRAPLTKSPLLGTILQDVASRMTDTLFLVRAFDGTDDERLRPLPANVHVLDDPCCLLADIHTSTLVRAVDVVVSDSPELAVDAALAHRPFVMVDSGEQHAYEHITQVPMESLLGHLRRIDNDRQADSAAGERYLTSDVRPGGMTRRVLDVIAAELAADESPVVSPSGLLGALAELVTIQALELADARILAARPSPACQQAVQYYREENDTLRRIIRARDRMRPGPSVARTRVALFGASSLGRASMARLRAIPNVAVECFLDNDPAKWHQEVEGLPVMRPQAAVLDGVDWIVVTSMHVSGIVQQVMDEGYGHKLLLDCAELQHRLDPTT